MKILLVTYHWCRSATGICVQRIVEGLLELGCAIELFYGSGRPAIQHERLACHQCAQWPFRPQILFEKISNIVRWDLQNLAWRKRAESAMIKAFRNDGADCIYAVASPVSGLLAGRGASVLTGLPLVTHFMDPIPAPEQWVDNKAYRQRMINSSLSVMNKAERIIFITAEAARYQEKSTGYLLRQKLRIIPNIIPQWTDLGQPSLSPVVMLFFGAFYRNRKPNSLLDGFRLFLKKTPNARLKVYGTAPEMILPQAEARGIEGSVEVCSRTEDFNQVFKKASILIDVDAPDKEAVFLSTKILEYLSVNRVILSISTPNSPAWRRYNDSGDAVITVSHQAEEIASGMEQAVRLAGTQDPAIFRHRIKGNRPYSKRAVAQKNLEMLRGVLDPYQEPAK
jgi:glycosyltransferase involved in cell wall biosynthesis